MADEETMAAVREATSGLMKKFALFHAQLCQKTPCPHNFKEEIAKVDAALSDGSGKDMLARLRTAENAVASSEERAEREKDRRIAAEGRIKSLEEENSKIKKALKG